MRLCDDGHEEICYENLGCPACDLVAKISDLEDTVFDLKGKIEELQEVE